MKTSKQPQEIGSNEKLLSKETTDFIDHIAEILAQEFVEAVKQEEKGNESSDLCQILK